MYILFIYIIERELYKVHDYGIWYRYKKESEREREYMKEEITVPDLLEGLLGSAWGSGNLRSWSIDSRLA